MAMPGPEEERRNALLPLLAGLVLVVVVLAAADCSALLRSGIAEPAPTASPAPTGPAGYRAALHAELGDVGSPGVTDDYLNSLGPSMCSAIDEGVSKHDIVTPAEGVPADQATLAAVLNAATTYLCPQHSGF